MPRLFVLSGDDIGRTYDFEGPVVLGRDGKCDVVLRSASVSRRHARLESHDDGGWVLRDLGSSNGISVGGVRTEEARLAEGTVFRLGELELRFRARLEVDDAAPRPTPSESPRAARPPAGAAGIELEGDWELVEPDRPSRAAPSRPAPARRAPSVSGATRGVAARARASPGGGLLSSDLGQHGALTRWALYLLALALCAAVGYGAFRLTLTLRAQAADPVVAD